MQNRSLALAAVAGGFLLLVIVATGQEPRQEWRIERTGSSGRVQFRIERWKPGSHWSNSHEERVSDFRGLSYDTIENGGAAKFEYVQDAGRLVCEGRFSSGRGSGTFTYVPNPQFSAELKSLGYAPPTEEDQFTMMMTGVSLDFARGIRDSGLQASTGQLIDLRIHGVSLDDVQQVQQAGYRNLSAQDYIDMRIHGVSADFIRYLKSTGYNLTAAQMIELRIHGVSTDFMRELKNAGYDLTSSQIVELRIHGVDPQFMRDLKAYGLQPPASEMVQLRIHGVTAEYLKGLKDAGFGTLPVGQITDLKIQGVSTDFIAETKSLGYNFTPAQLVRLRIHGVDGAYLRHLRDTGLRSLSAEQIEKLRIHGVD
jgi:hypothetical protein